jgi:hypothetical protein
MASILQACLSAACPERFSGTVVIGVLLLRLTKRTPSVRVSVCQQIMESESEFEKLIETLAWNVSKAPHHDADEADRTLHAAHDLLMSERAKEASPGQQLAMHTLASDCLDSERILREYAGPLAMRLAKEDLSQRAEASPDTCRLTRHRTVAPGAPLPHSVWVLGESNSIPCPPCWRSIWANPGPINSKRSCVALYFEPALDDPDRRGDNR